MKVVGVDLGGTEIKIGLVDKENGIEKKISLPTEVSKGTEKVVKNISDGISTISKGVKIDGIGIGSPGS
ncbi:MAG TPA: ROK family protein, partial [Petrotogaceae bacterium]|nr:ROK family protein [Petrotogaceae bacterium]